MESVIATVKNIYGVTERLSKNRGASFRTQKVVIEFNEAAAYPSRIVLEQSGDKAIQVVESLKVGEKYEFSLNYRANEWTDPKTNTPTAFGSISAWRVDALTEGETST